MAETTPSSPPTQKVSRYRSQRQAQRASAQEEPPKLPQSPPQQPSSPANDGIERSKSRYRRPGTAGGTTRPATVKDQEQIDVPLRPRTSTKQAPQQPADTTRRPATHGSISRKRDSDRHRDRHASPPVLAGAGDARRVRSNELDEDAEEDRRRRLKAKYVHAQEVPSPESPPIHAPKKPSVTDLFPPPKPESVKAPKKAVQFDGPPTSDGIRATKSMADLPHYVDEEKGGCFGLFKRKRPEQDPNAENTPIARHPSDREKDIKAGGGGVVPGIDAPISAVNAGDRTVVVECGVSKSIFPVTPTTTPVDLIKSAATCMNEPISVKSAILLEHFGTVGVQRPLRRYEHIRDVMNSWDTDRQNSVLLVDPGTGTSETELTVAGVPSKQPEDDSWLLHISQKPGKWDKCMIHLRSDGQMTLQKNPKKPQDQVNICHLSDFDIYTPTQEKIKKKIKPPKKICFAIKSQQKTSMFQSMDNFVHFICTNDRRTADTFYAAIQGWRSWYLVHVMGEGKKAKPAQEPPVVETNAGVAEKAHKAEKSQDSHYQLGSFMPLMDADQIGRRPASSDGPTKNSAGFTKSSSQFDTTISPERRTSTARRRQHPPGSMNKRGQLAEDEPLANLGRRNSVDKRRPSLEQTRSKSDDEFMANGLLGRSYSQKRRDYDEREANKPSPFTEGATFLSSGYEAADTTNKRSSLDGGPRRGYSTRQRPETSDIKRGASTRRGHEDKKPSLDLQRSNSRSRDMPKPLVDLTPSYREPPQHIKKGKGFKPDDVGPGGLIGNATSPEDPIGAPAATEWRGRNHHQQLHGSSRPEMVRGDSDHRSPSQPRVAALNGKSVRRQHEPMPTANAFTGEGLLAGSQGKSGWGGGDKGRGVMDGSRAKGPMVDLGNESQFQQGSLLNRVEREQGGRPVIDRDHEGGY